MERKLQIQRLKVRCLTYAPHRATLTLNLECLRVFTRFPQMAKVYFGGGHDNGYTSTLTSLENEGFLDKIVLLRGYRNIALELKSLRLPHLEIDRLFMAEKIPTNTQKKSTSSYSSPPPALDTGKPKNTSFMPPNDEHPPGPKHLDPKLVRLYVNASSHITDPQFIPVAYKQTFVLANIFRCLQTYHVFVQINHLHATSTTCRSASKARIVIMATIIL